MTTTTCPTAWCRVVGIMRGRPFVVRLDVGRDWKVKKAAALVHRMKGWHLYNVRNYCKDRHWSLEEYNGDNRRIDELALPPVRRPITQEGLFRHAKDV